MKKEMLINVLQPEECRIAIIEDGILEELYVERTSHESYTGNIYKGKIVNLEPAIQAAFVDFSVGRNGFLHVSDVEPQYFDRHLGEPFEPEPAPRERTREREPRRGRGRGRDDRRRPPAIDDLNASGEPPPRSSERPRERGRDDPRDRDRGRERERPDQSIRGRRDRSQPPPRRFGEGLVEPQDLPAERPRADEMSAMPARAPIEEQPAPPTAAVEPPGHEAFIWRDRSGPHPGDEAGQEPGPRIQPEREFAQGFDTTSFADRGAEAAELAGRPAQLEPAPEEPFDADLPPSRTQRARPAPRVGAEPKEWEQGRHRAPHPLPPAEERQELTEERPADQEIETLAARDPRKGRNRGRASSPSGRTRPLPPPEEEAALELDVVPETTAQETRAPEDTPALPGFEEPSAFDEPPRRRGGRAAIRARGGESERPRDFPPSGDFVPERQPRRPPGPDERDRGRAIPHRAETEERRAPESSQPRRAPERDRDRGRRPAHGRAGEPGYVPRRERLHSADTPFGADVFPADSSWQDRDAELDLDAEMELPLGGLAAEEDLGIGPERGAHEAPSMRKPDPRRRRRRRGRRREREREPGPAKYDAPDSPATSEFESDFEDYSEVDTRRPQARDFGPAGETLDHLDELELDDDDFDRDLLDDEDFVGERRPKEAPAAFEEEIDAELEQEIRKEIEEIEELEREMGMRGSPEAAGRRGDEFGRGGRSARGRGLVKPPIQEIFRRGDEVLVQVIKESIGTKGPTLSTYISIPGRYLVLMPGLNRVGVSRKIVDEGQRRKLREIMHELNPPKGLGFIVRTAGLERTKRELARDLAYLLRLWKVILRRIKKSRAPTPIYQESDMIIRTIRDIFTSEIDTIWIDEPSAFERAQDFLRVVMPRFVNRLKLYDEKVPLFHKYGIEDEIAKIQRRHVPLPEGGSIVIDQTEALVAIDVNSGNFRVENDAEKTAYEMNLRAAKEIARQLRLRDLGGVIVNDFIDMREERHRRGVERAVREAIKRDRARTKVLRMSAFGLIEMTRQRIRPSLKRSIYEDCPHCSGAGVVKTAESMAIDVMRLLALATHRDEIRRVVISVSSNVAAYLSNRKRKEIARIEQECQMAIQIGFQENFAAEHLQIECYDANGNEVRLHPTPPPSHRRGH
jgi:ribonuclease E